MALNFQYRVRDKGGKELKGSLSGDSQALVITKLRSMGYVPIQITEVKPGLKREIHLRPGKVKQKDLAVFSRQFATMINSGLTLLRALAILEQQTESTILAKVIGEVRQDVETGSSLSAALGKHPKSFPSIYTAMVRAGEAGGVLDTVLTRLADTIEREVALRQKIKSAMTYPVVVLGMVICIMSAMLLFVVPTFKDLYADLGGTLPLPTRILLALSDIVKKYFLIIVGLFVMFMFFFRRWAKTPAGRFAVDRFKLRAPVFGPLVQKTAISRFARTLGSLAQSGVPLLQSLDIVSDTVGNSVVSRALDDVKEGVRQGESLSKPLEKHAVFPPMVVQMLSVGEETGALDTMLGKVADFYDDEVTATVEALTSLIEPIMIAFVGGGVGLMVVALYMPMFNIINLVK